MLNTLTCDVFFNFYQTPRQCGAYKFLRSAYAASYLLGTSNGWSALSPTSVFKQVQNLKNVDFNVAKSLKNSKVLPARWPNATVHSF
jgi:hypothetical protein